MSTKINEKCTYISTEAILERIKLAKSLKSDREIAALIGLSPQDFSNRKKRDTLRPLIFEWAVREGININWLICEQEGTYRSKEDGGSSADVFDPNLLREVITAVEEGLTELRLEIKGEKKADLIVTLYELRQKGRAVDGPTLIRLIKLTA